MSEWLELRPDHKGNFDELTARFADGMVHAEMMSNKGIYIGFYMDDGRQCQFWLSSDKKLRVHTEISKTDPPRYTAQGVDTKPHPWSQKSTRASLNPTASEKVTSGYLKSGTGRSSMREG